MRKKTIAFNGAFRNRFPGIPVPSRQAIYNFFKLFEENGLVADLSRSRRPSTVNADNLQLVASSNSRKPVSVIVEKRYTFWNKC